MNEDLKYQEYLSNGGALPYEEYVSAATLFSQIESVDEDLKKKDPPTENGTPSLTTGTPPSQTELPTLPNPIPENEFMVPLGSEQDLISPSLGITAEMPSTDLPSTATVSSGTENSNVNLPTVTQPALSNVGDTVLPTIQKPKTPLDVLAGKSNDTQVDTAIPSNPAEINADASENNFEANQLKIDAQKSSNDFIDQYKNKDYASKIEEFNPDKPKWIDKVVGGVNQNYVNQILEKEKRGEVKVARNTDGQLIDKDSKPITDNSNILWQPQGKYIDEYNAEARNYNYQVGEQNIDSARFNQGNVVNEPEQDGFGEFAGKASKFGVLPTTDEYANLTTTEQRNEYLANLEAAQNAQKNGTTFQEEYDKVIPKYALTEQVKIANGFEALNLLNGGLESGNTQDKSESDFFNNYFSDKNNVLQFGEYWNNEGKAKYQSSQVMENQANYQAHRAEIWNDYLSYQNDKLGTDARFIEEAITNDSALADRYALSGDVLSAQKEIEKVNNLSAQYNANEEGRTKISNLYSESNKNFTQLQKQKKQEEDLQIRVENGDVLSNVGNILGQIPLGIATSVNSTISGVGRIVSSVIPSDNLKDALDIMSTTDLKVGNVKVASLSNKIVDFIGSDGSKYREINGRTYGIKSDGKLFATQYNRGQNDKVEKESVDYNWGSGLAFVTSKMMTDIVLTSAVGGGINKGLASASSRIANSKNIATVFGEGSQLAKSAESFARLAKNADNVSVSGWYVQMYNDSYQMAERGGIKGELNKTLYAITQSFMQSVIQRINPDINFLKSMNNESRQIVRALMTNEKDKAVQLISAFVKKTGNNVLKETGEELVQQVTQDLNNIVINKIGKTNLETTDGQGYKEVVFGTVIPSALASLMGGKGSRIANINNKEIDLTTYSRNELVTELARDKNGVDLIKDFRNTAYFQSQKDFAQDIANEITERQKYISKVPEVDKYSTPVLSEVAPILQQIDKKKEDLKKDDGTFAERINKDIAELTTQANAILDNDLTPNNESPNAETAQPTPQSETVQEQTTETEQSQVATQSEQPTITGEQNIPSELNPTQDGQTTAEIQSTESEIEKVGQTSQTEGNNATDQLSEVVEGNAEPENVAQEIASQEEINEDDIVLSDDIFDLINSVEDDTQTTNNTTLDGNTESSVSVIQQNEQSGQENTQTVSETVDVGRSEGNVEINNNQYENNGKVYTKADNGDFLADNGRKVTNPKTIKSLQEKADARREETLVQTLEKNGYKYKKYSDGSEVLISPKGTEMSPTNKNGKANANYRKAKARIFGEKTENEIRIEDRARIDEAVKNFIPTNPRDAILQYFAGGGKVDKDYVSRKVAGNSVRLEARGKQKRSIEDYRWAWFTDKRPKTGEQIAEEISTGDFAQMNFDEQDLRNAVDDVIMTYNNVAEVQDDLLNLYNSDNDPYYGLTESDAFAMWQMEATPQEIALVESVQAEAGLTEDQRKEYYKTQFENSINSLSNEQQDELYRKTETNFGRNEGVQSENANATNRQEESSVSQEVDLQTTTQDFTPIPQATYDKLVKKLLGVFKKFGGKIIIDINDYKGTDIGTDFTLPNGEIYGAKFPDGTIYLNPEKINANTPIHEFSHLWQQLMPLRFKKGVELLKNTPIGKRTFTQLRENEGYANKTNDELWNEALVTVMGNEGERVFNSSKASKFKEWITDLFKALGNAFGIRKLTPIDNLSTFVKGALGEVMGKNELIPEKIIMKSGVYDLFRSNTELKSVGTPEQYSNYLSTVFPDSSENAIYYHGTSEQQKPSEKFKGYITYVTNNKKYAESFGIPVNRVVVPVVVDVKKPYMATSELLDVPKEVHDSNAFTNPRIIKENNGNKYDAVIGIDAGQKEGNAIAIFNPDQINILGSKKDVEGFKKYVSKNRNIDFQIPNYPKPINLMPKSLITNIADSIRNGGKGSEIMNIVQDSNWFKGLGESTKANMTFNDVKSNLIDSDKYHRENDKVKAKEKADARVKSAKEKVTAKFNSQNEKVKSAKEVVLQEINNALENRSFKGDAKQRVVASVAKRLVKAVSLSENKNILNYIKKVISNADYNQDLQLAKSNQSRIRKVASSTTYSKAKTNVNIAKAFARLNPNNVSDIKEYNIIASQILNNLKGLKINTKFEVSGEDYKISNEEIEAYTDKEFERALKLADERKRDNFQDKVDEGLIPEGMTYEEYSDITDVKNEEDYLAKQKELSAEKKKQVLGIAKSLVDTKKGELKNYADDNKGTFTEAEEKVLNSLDKIPTENLSLEQLVKINDIINNIVTNNSFSDSLGIASLQKSIENFSNLEEKIKTKGWIFSRLSTEGLNGIWQGLVSNDMLVEYIARLPKAAAELKRFSGISKVADGNAKAKIEQQKIYSEFEGLRNTLSREVGVNLNTTDSRIHRGIIARLFQNFGGSVEENQDEFNRQKGLIKDHYEKLVARSKTDKAYEKQIKEGEAVKEFYEKYVDGVDNLPDFVKGLGSAEQKANLKMVKFWVDKFATYKDLFFEQSDMLNNKPLEDIGNYTATKEKNFDGVIDDKALEDYLTNRFFGNPSIAVKPSGAKNNRVRQRSLGVNKLLNLDFDFIQNDVMHTNLHDLYTSDGVSELRNFFANPNTEKLLGGKHNYDLLKSQMEQTIQHQRGNLQFTNNKAMKALNKGLEVLQAKGARSALASFTQFPKQYISVAVNLFGNMGTDAGLIIDAIKMSNNAEFFNSKNIGLRGSTKGGYNKESIFRQDDSNIRSAFENQSSQLYELLMKPLEKSDVSIARTSYLAFYMKDLKKRGIKFTTDEIMSEGYKLDEEASAYAEQMVSINQNANDASSMASAFKNTDTAMQFIKNVFLPFSTFSTNQRARMTLDFKNVMNGSAEQRKESAKSLVATMAEQATFNGIKIALNYALTVAGISASKMIGLTDDDDEERAKKFLKEGLWNKFKMNTINDMFFTGMGSLTEKGLQTVTNEAFKITDNKPPFFIFDGSNEPSITADWGVYSSGVKLYYNFGNDIYKLAKPYKTVVGGGYETKIVEIDGELPKEARNAYALNLVIDGLTLFGMSDQTVSTVNNRIRRDADKFVLDNLGGKKIEITSPVNASKRSVGFAKDVLNKEKTIAQVNKEIDAIKGFSEKQKTGIKNSVALRVKFPDVDKVLFDVKFTTDYTKKAEMLINSYPDNDLTDQSPESKKIIAQMVKIGGVKFTKAKSKYIQLLKDKKANK